MELFYRDSHVSTSKLVLKKKKEKEKKRKERNTAVATGVQGFMSSQNSYLVNGT